MVRFLNAPAGSLTAPAHLIQQRIEEGYMPDVTRWR